MKGNYQKTFPLFVMGTGNPKKYNHFLGTGIQGLPIGKYTGTGIPAHACVLLFNYRGTVGNASAYFTVWLMW